MWVLVALAVYLLIQAMIWMIKLGCVMAYWMAVAAVKLTIWAFVGVALLFVGTVTLIQGRRQQLLR